MSSRIDKLNQKELEEKEERKREKKEKRKKAYHKLIIIIIFLFTITIVYASLIEPNMLLIDEHRLTNYKLSNSFSGKKILQFADLHYGTSINQNNINKVIDKINITKPDIVIFAGDLVEEGYEMSKQDIETLENALLSIKATLGKYAVIGNHDYNNSNYKNIIYNGGFTLLVNNYDIIYSQTGSPIIIYGTDDYMFGNPNIDSLKDEAISSYYKILVTHEPDYIDIIKDENIDLVLAGHSHDGQIKIPLITKVFLPEKARIYYHKYYKVNDKDLYITNGVGTRFISLRFGSPPSMNLFRIN